MRPLTSLLAIEAPFVVRAIAQHPVLTSVQLTGMFFRQPKPSYWFDCWTSIVSDPSTVSSPTPCRTRRHSGFPGPGPRPLQRRLTGRTLRAVTAPLPAGVAACRARTRAFTGALCPPPRRGRCRASQSSACSWQSVSNGPSRVFDPPLHRVPQRPPPARWQCRSKRAASRRRWQRECCPFQCLSAEREPS